MKRSCPNPKCSCPKIKKDGFFKRKDDSRYVQRFKCGTCLKKFSVSTFHLEYRQKKRRVNVPLARLLSSGISLRRSARLLKLNPKTVERKLVYLGKKARMSHVKFLGKISKVQNLQIDDLITKENTKLKPLSVSLAVNEDRRFILGAEVSQIPAFGHLSKISIDKYGERKCFHEKGLERLFQSIHRFVESECLIKSDEHKKYPYFIKNYFPRGKHETYPSERACVAGQGELKKVKFDPLFAVNHTCAMLRANINRLIRKTWCTTKRIDRLKDHLDIFIHFHNQHLLESS